MIELNNAIFSFRLIRKKLKNQISGDIVLVEIFISHNVNHKNVLNDVNFALFKILLLLYNEFGILRSWSKGNKRYWQTFNSHETEVWKRDSQIIFDGIPT